MKTLAIEISYSKFLVLDPKDAGAVADALTRARIVTGGSYDEKPLIVIPDAALSVMFIDESRVTNEDAKPAGPVAATEDL